MVEFSRACNWSMEGWTASAAQVTGAGQTRLLKPDLHLEDCAGSIGVKESGKAPPTEGFIRVKVCGLREHAWCVNSGESTARQGGGVRGTRLGVEQEAGEGHGVTVGRNQKAKWRSEA